MQVISPFELILFLLICNVRNQSIFIAFNLIISISCSLKKKVANNIIRESDKER